MLKEKLDEARSAGDFEELATEYAEENDVLRRQIDQLENDLRESEIRELQLENKVGFYRNRISELEGTQQSNQPIDSDEERDDLTPQMGEVRFYKKRYAARGHDVLVQIGDCGHNRWEAAHKADKARKGIAKLEGVEQTWKRLEHCAVCEGGGVWRVEW